MSLRTRLLQEIALDLLQRHGSHKLLEEEDKVEGTEAEGKQRKEEGQDARQSQSLGKQEEGKARQAQSYQEGQETRQAQSRKKDAQGQPPSRGSSKDQRTTAS